MKKVISTGNLPARFPLTPTAVAYLLLDRFKAAGWVWGVVGTFLVIAWISEIVLICFTEKVDIFRDGVK